MQLSHPCVVIDHDSEKVGKSDSYIGPGLQQHGELLKTVYENSFSYLTFILTALSLIKYAKE